MLIPVCLSLVYAMTDYSVLEKPVFIGLDNFREMWTDRVLWRAAGNTAVYAAMTVALSTVVSVLTAVLIERAARTRGLAPLAGLTRVVVFAPTLVPVVAAALAWLWTLNTQKGPVNAVLTPVLSVFGLSPIDWLGSTAWAMVSIVLVSLWGVGTYVVIYGAAIRNVPAALYEAATIDGCGSWGRFVNVTLPMISPAIVLNVVMSMIWSLQAFAVPLVMTRGGPGDATLTYAMHVYNNAFVFSRMGYACALAWVQFLVTLALVAIVLRLSRGAVYARGA
jgi:multiple sugar transport system permease protein